MDLWMDVDAALAEVPVNILPLLDDTDFKTIEAAVVYNQAGLALFWNFVTTAGVQTCTAVTPTSGGDYDWTDQGTSGMYAIEIPASGGASINNDTEGFGWFTGVATGVLPWRGPVIGFRAAGLNDLLIDSAYSATRGLTGTALPAAAAEAAGGLYTRGTGAGQINQQANGQIDSNLERWINVAPLALSSQRVQVLVGAITNGVLVAASFAAGAFDAVWSVAARILTAATNITSTGGTTVPQTGDSFARIGAAGAGLTALGDARIANLDATVSSRASQTSVDDLPTNAELATALTNLDAAVSSRATPAQVNTEVLDVLNVDTFAEPTGVPAATTTLAGKLGRLYQGLRNRVDVDSNTGKKQFFDDANAALWEKDVSDAGGVYSETEGNAP